MKKKKIAVFGSGWSAEILYQYLLGVRDGLADECADIYLFLCHASLAGDQAFAQGEINIYNLPNLEDFDAALILANGIDFPEVLQQIKERCSAANIPTIVTCNDNGEHYVVDADNYVGTKQLCDHIIDKHGVRDIIYIAGSKGNMDSNIRMQAIRDALQERGMQLLSSNIIYSNWDLGSAAYPIIDLVESGKKLPDAIVCANDTMAMVICKELDNRGVRVPEDIIVTGFDNASLAQTFLPSISSVNQRFDEIGIVSARMLIDLLAGRQCQKRIEVACEFVPSESCGCNCPQDVSEVRRMMGRIRFEENIKASLFAQKMAKIERGVLKGKCYEDLSHNLYKINSAKDNFEGDSFHIVLDPLYERMIDNQDKKLRTQGYAPIMDAVFSMDKGVMNHYPQFETRKLVPQITNPDENHLFIFLPLHEDDGALGYLVFCDDYQKLVDTETLYKYAERLSIVLTKHLRDLKVDVLHHRLLELTETDALTHVKNRTAYEAREEILDAGILSYDNFAFGIAIFDINNLKQINDQLGHEMGDDYIIHASQLICKIFKKSAVYRIGGDEFAVILEGYDYQHRKQLIEQLVQNMEEIAQSDVPIYEKVSVASGIATFDSKKDKSVADVFKRADARMYENKAYMKAKIKK